jgi:hypothetical protein
MKMNDKTQGANPASEIELLTPKEAAALFRLSESFLAKARMRGDGPRYRKLSRSVRYTSADLLLWLKASAKTSTAEWDRDDRRDQTVASDEQKLGMTRKEEE